MKIVRNMFALIVAIAVAGIATFAAQQFNGLTWIGEHKDGMYYPFSLRINDPTLYHNTTLNVTVYGLDLSEATLQNNWGNAIAVTGTAPNYTLTVSAAAGNDPNYVGLSANIWATENVPLTGIGSTPVYGKIGTFTAATAKTGTVKYGDSKAYYLISSDNSRTVTIFVNEKDATKAVISLAAKTKVTYSVDGHKLGECSNTGTSAANCDVNAPTGTTFGELPTRYVSLKIESAVSPLPAPAVTIGVVVP